MTLLLLVSGHNNADCGVGFQYPHPNLPNPSQGPTHYWPRYDSFLLPTISHFVMTLPQAGKQDNLRFQDIFKIQLMALAFIMNLK